MRRRVVFLPVLLAAFFMAGCEMAAPTPVPTPATYAIAPSLRNGIRCSARVAGAPITGQCLPGDSMVVQYFEFAAEQTTDGTIQFYPLGSGHWGGAAGSPLRTCR